jgi:arabinogalactan endo-1,4-beta-galactosidase
MLRTILAFVASLTAVASAQTTRPFVAGVDANYALELERVGTTWRVDGAQVDPFVALARAGFDGFRVRLWTGDDGPNGLNDAIETAKRAQAAGLRPYVVIFLSENWADLVKQPVPAIWKDLDAGAKLRAIETYAERVARRFADEKIDVELFEIGNEIDFGLCGVFEEAWPKRVSVDHMRANIWPRMAPMIAAAQRGVRKVRPDARFTLHLAQWNKADWCIAFWRFMREQGVAVDLAGLSYFPTSVAESSERPLPYLVAIAQKIRDAIGVPVLICETGYPSEPNFPGQFADWNKPVDGYPLNAEGQRRWLVDFLAATRASPAIAGAYYWSPEGTTGDLWRAFALFDADGNAGPAIAPTTRPATQPTSQPTTVPAATGVAVYFGNLHAHTAISDGTGTPAQAFAFARDVAKLDFMAIAEHNHLMGGEKATAAKRRQLYVADEANGLVPVARRFTEDGKFVAIAGQEFSSMSKGNHVNVFDVDEPIDPTDVPNGDFAGLLKWLDKHRDSSGKPAVMQLNHPMLGRPGKTIEANEYGRDDFGDDAGWIKAMGGATSLIELLNGEGKAGSRRSPQIMDRHYLLYLRAGFRVAPVGNQDNHKTDWGTSTETRTGVIAPALTRAALIDALRSRHAYATEDANLRVIVRVNGKLAGDVLDSPGEATIAYEIRDADESFATYTIDVYRGTVGGELASIVKTVEGVRATPPGVANVLDGIRLDAGQYLFVRVTQHDESSDRTWTAPVWVDAR